MSSIRSMTARISIIACFLLLPPIAFAQTYVFNKAEFATGNNPTSLIAADLNGDGQPDFAVTNRNDNTISILLGKPNGTFQPHIDYAAGSGPVSIIAGDFNGDGKVDLAVANVASNTISIFLGNGDGTFQPHVDYPTGSTPVSVIAGDFNRDGKLDLAVANAGSNTISILLGNGDGTFRAHVDYPTGSAPLSVIAGDFNGDGKLDLAVANSGSNTVSVLLGNGDGTFQAFVGYGTSQNPTSVIAGDFNGDGKLDLAVGGTTVSIFLGNGDGTFQHTLDLVTGVNTVLTMAAVDLNGDGKLDLAVGGTVSALAGGVSVLLGNGDGTFQPSHRYATNANVLSITTGDFNGDGRPDLAAASFSDTDLGPQGNSVSVFLGNGDGTFISENRYGLAGSAQSITTVDFNRDGILDLAVATYSNNVSILLGNGDGTFQSHVDYPTGLGPNSVIAGDFNGDGKLDLAVANSGSNTVSILLGNGDGTFKTHVDYATGSGPVSVTTGDFNGDGRPDLAVSNRDSNTISILLGNGDGTFQPHVDYATGDEPKSVVTADFNQDGKLDLAVANYNGSGCNGQCPAGTVSILLGNGNGTFQPRTDYTAGGPFTDSVIAGDFNGDGRLDLAVANQANSDTLKGNQAAILLGNGDGTFQAPVDYVAGDSANVVTTGDLNGDTALDIAVGTADGVSVLLGNGDGTFRVRSMYAADNGVVSLANGDFEGYGPLDLAVATGDVLVFLNKPIIALFPSGLSFGNEPVGKTSSTLTVLVSNPGSAPLHVSQISVTGDYAQTSDCLSGSLLPGASCTIGVTFTPTMPGHRTGAVTITDSSATSPQIIGLSGTGIAPTLILSAKSLGFPGEPLGVMSPPKKIKLTSSINNGIPVTITNIGTTGDFAETNNCPPSLAPGAFCTVSVTFTPTGYGKRAGTLSITDNAVGSPQTASLTGTGPDFTITASPKSETVMRGQAATFTITLTPKNGFSQSIMLTCIGNPRNSICGISPTSVTLDGVHAATATATIMTANTTPTGTFTVTFSGAFGAVIHRTAVKLTVQ